MASSSEGNLEWKVDQILTLLRGNPLDKDDNGLVGVVNILDKRVMKLEKLRNKILWVVVGMSIPSGFGITKILMAVAEAIHK